jgi:hypothetical protein
MQRIIGILSALLFAVGCCKAAAEDREAILNYSDPHSMALALAVVPHADQLSLWTRGRAPLTSASEIGQFAFVGGTTTERTKRITKYLFSSSRMSTKATDNTVDMPGLRLNTGLGEDVEIQPTNDELLTLPPCGPGYEQPTPCRVSDLSQGILLIALRHAENFSGKLDSLLSSRHLVKDDQATKRVIVAFNPMNTIQHIDFVGLVRGQNERLLAPDAASVFVVRLSSDGAFSIVERHQDSSVNPSDIKFKFEE